MNIGSLYRLTEEAKNNYRKQQEGYKDRFGAIPLGLYFYLTAGKSIHIPFETVIVPLEIQSTTGSGRPLGDENLRRVIVLLTTGEVATAYLDLSAWEEVTNESLDW